MAEIDKSEVQAAFDQLEKEQPDEDEKPSPDEVDAASSSRHIFERDSNGQLVPRDDVIKVEGEWFSVRHIPPTKGLLSQVRTKFEGRDEVNLDEIDEVMDDFFVDPNPDDWDDMSPALYIPMMMFMVNKITDGMDDDTTEDLEAAVQERQAQGN